MIPISKTHDLLGMAMDYRAMRQDMIASNIANADTPGYRPRDVRFEEMMVAKKNELLHQNSPQLEMAQTNGAHIALTPEKDYTKATTYFRDGHMARNDGNSVDLDVESTEMSKNAVMFNALVAMNKKSSMIFTSVIDASSKVN